MIADLSNIPESVSVRVIALRKLNDPTINIVLNWCVAGLEGNAAGLWINFIRYFHTEVFQAPRAPGVPGHTFMFTRDQLNKLLGGTVDMFMEYRDVHGKTEENARYAAVNEMFEGLDAERELVEAGEAKPVLQVLDEALVRGMKHE